MGDRAATNLGELGDTPSGAAAAGAQLFRDIRHLATLCEGLALDAGSAGGASGRDELLDDINRVCAIQRAIVALATAGANDLDALDLHLLREAPLGTHETANGINSHRQEGARTS